ncbi:Capsular exopolysaccharide biosynthesis protein [Hyella patelloides LEGE 07179]|uniref:non-specific protein-tyrosine kinase n=1 Tax=Hyella patelloides LEGE 07179 TaxID=945734 RepID=A0A563VSV6_9CYAN|nr:polysaccharide biosynthesis tyrosine autokinase [Hyella patelloides]VEP14359.1 Capsular exopolysaccharide biosynthesis protein [Hyella patelloides LEGE 07179]
MVNSLTNNGGSQPDNSYPNYGLEESRESTDIEIASYFQKLKRRWKPALAVFLLTVVSTFAATSLLEEKYQAEGKILFKQKNNLLPVGEGVGELTTFLNNQTPLLTQQEVISSAPVLQQTIEILKLTNEEGETLTAKDLRRKLQVGLVGGSDVIEIIYKDSDPIQASQVVNTLMDVYIKNQVRSNQAETENADSFVTTQIPQVEDKLKQNESILQEFRTKHKIVDLQEEKKVLVAELGTLNRQIATTGSQLKGTQAQTASLQKQLGLSLNQAIAVSQLGNSPTVQSILTELGNTEIELAQERQRFKDSHPSISSLLEKKANLRQDIEQQVAQAVGTGVKVSDGLLQDNRFQENPLEKFINLKIEELSLQQQLSSTYDYQQAYLKRAEQLPKLEQREREINQKVETARSTYENLLSTQQELQILRNKQTGNAEIIEQAIAPENGSTGRMALMLLGILMGLLLSNLTAIYLDMQDRTIKTIADIKKKLPYKVLGIVPINELSDRQGVLVQQEPDSYASETYRMIQANLKFMTTQRPPKVILITSSAPGEGKSTVTANLAAAIAQLGRRVLLIDGDLRKSSQHQLWGVSNQVGIKDLVTNQASVRDVASKPMAKLDLLTSGMIPPNPLALLDSNEMGELVAKARKEYDIVLIDAPPLPVTADVLTISKLVDGIVFVSRPGVIEHESAELAIEALESTRQKVLGMVINGVNGKECDRYSYSAKYGKGYFSDKKSSDKTKSSTITV